MLRTQPNTVTKSLHRWLQKKRVLRPFTAHTVRENDCGCFPKRVPKKNRFFSYYSHQGHRGRTEPESLTYTLCKQALVRIAEEGAETLLYLTYKGERSQSGIPIRFTGGKAEYPVCANGSNYVIDAYCTFEGVGDDSFLFSHACRWQGQIAFEIWYSHSMSDSRQKCLDLEAAGIPVIQIKTNDTQSPLYIDEAKFASMGLEAADAAVSSHLNKLCAMFRKQIYGVLYNNSQSPVYREARELKKRCSTLEELVADKENALQSVLRECESREEQLAEAVKKRNSWQHAAVENSSELNNVALRNRQLTEENEALKLQLRALQASADGTVSGWFKRLFGIK